MISDKVIKERFRISSGPKVARWLMDAHGYSFDEALESIKRVRPKKRKHHDFS